MTFGTGRSTNLALIALMALILFVLSQGQIICLTRNPAVWMQKQTLDISAERSALSKQRQHSMEKNKAAILDTIRINLQRTQESLGLDQEYLKSFLVWKMVMLLLVLMIFSLFEKTFCKVFVTFVTCTASQLICSLCCTWNDVQTFSNGIGECSNFWKHIIFV